MKKQTGKTAKKTAPAKPQAPKKAEHRVLTMADYRAMEKVAHALTTMCKLRRKCGDADRDRVHRPQPRQAPRDRVERQRLKGENQK